jgi:biopolymer transport protein ExbB
MNANLMHDIIFYVMYASLAVALVIITERALYFAYTQRQAKRLEQALTPQVQHLADLPKVLTERDSLPLAVIRQVLEQKHLAGDRETISDLIDAQYLLSKPLMVRGLWLLETVVTAAPLLGLLGTVMGIIETFKALATAGVSDASQVSAGMGTALYATALGIAIALVCLAGNNFLQNRMERVNELLKVLLIRAGTENDHQARGEPRYA